MEELQQIITAVRNFKGSLLEDPLGTIPVLADFLQELGEFGEEAAHAIRYVRDMRLGLRKREKKWDEWVKSVMKKYGKDSHEVMNRDGIMVMQLRQRLLTVYTEVECFHGDIFEHEIKGHPILSVALRQTRWSTIYKLGSAVFANTEDVILDFRDSMDVFTVGVVHACEVIDMPRLKNLGVLVTENRQLATVKGRTSVALMGAIEKGRVPRGVQLWWNGKPS